MNKKRLMALFMAAMLAVTMLAGCGEKAEENKGAGLQPGEVSYPIETEETLTIWKPLNGTLSTHTSSENEIPFTEELIKRTGIKVEYIHPPMGQEGEKFNLMISSGELPDIIVYDISGTSEGIDGMIDGGYVKELSEDFLKDYSPNLWKKIQEDKELQRWCTSNEGRYFGWPGYREADFMTAYHGLMIRDDYLKQAGKSTPETIDEWYDVLTAFKDMGIEKPLSFQGTWPFEVAGAFCGAYGVKMDFYADNGEVKYGPMQAGYKDFLETMNKWYSEGLLDNNFAAVSRNDIDALMLNGKAGATYGLIGGYMGKYLTAKEGDSSFSLQAAPYPSLEKGEKSEFGYRDSQYHVPQVWISGTCKNPELAARFLDYAFSEEGHMYYNFGTEGVSYEMVDGYPTYTELITKNPEGLSGSAALTKYTQAYAGAFMMDERFYKQQYAYKPQQDASDIWIETNAASHILYGASSLGAEDISRLSAIMTDVKSYVNEMTTKYIMGIEDLKTFDDFVNRLKEMNIEEAVEIRQRGYDSFVNK